MIWTVIYREDASGRQGKLELEAANRGDVLDQMRAKKLRVLNVVEGRLVADKPEGAARRKRGESVGLARRLLFWVVFGIGALAIAWYFFRDTPMVNDLLHRGEKPEPNGRVEIGPPGTVRESSRSGKEAPTGVTIKVHPAEPVSR